MVLHDPALRLFGTIAACTICTDLNRFELLIGDMEALFGSTWGELTPEDAPEFLTRPEAGTLHLIVIAAGAGDAARLAPILPALEQARARGVRLVLICEAPQTAGLPPELQRIAAATLPYPLEEGHLAEALGRLLPPPSAARAERKGERGTVIAVQGLAGGVGATTFAVNLAWELAHFDRNRPVRVALLDLDLQGGAVATYLDLQCRQASHDLLADAGKVDADTLSQALQGEEQRLMVLTAPPEIVPLDILGPSEVETLIETARRQFDFVVIDMPGVLVHWTEGVLHKSSVYYLVLELDMRSAQNAMRLHRLVESEGLPRDRLRHVLNRAPRLTDLQGRARVRRLTETLDVTLAASLPDGGSQVRHACDYGQPLGRSAARLPLRREIRKLAEAHLAEVAQRDQTPGS